MHNIKRTLAMLLVLVMMVCCFGAVTVSAAEVPEEFDLWIAYGGDKAAENDWGWQYYGADAEGITASNAKIKVGETATVSLTFDTPAVNSWFFAPCLTAADVTGITTMDFTVTCKINGEEVAIDMAADADGKTWWTEGTGDYTGEQCIRLAGGYNEWATKYIAEPGEVTTIEYTVTLNAVSDTVEVSDAPAALPEEFDLFIAYGGDKAAENDWAWGYTGTDVEGITAVNAKIKAGETQTVSLTFDGGNVNSWYFAPCLVAPGAGTAVKGLDFTVTCKIDGADVAIDMAADAEGKTWWAEATGDHAAENCLRLAGGYNEWATQYIAEPAGFTTIEYTVTLNSVSGDAAEEVVEETEPAAVFDPNGSYNAYLGLQTPNWTYRDAWNSANGIGSDYWGDFIYGNETSEKYGKVTDAVVAGNGTYTVSVTDFGTVFADDFTTAAQEYFNLLYISTDIPLSDDIAISDVKLIVDGSTKHTYSEAFLDPDETEYVKILIQNIWNADVSEISYYPAPTSSLEMQFTISGFAYDNESQAVEETEAATEAPTEAPAVEEPAAESGSSVGIIVAVVAVIAVAAVVVVVLKKKKAN